MSGLQKDDFCMETSDHDDSEIILKRSEEKFNMLFEYSPVGMALVDHETGRFYEVNQSLLASTGYTKDEFLNLSYWDITPAEYNEQELQQIKDLDEKGRFGPNEKEYIRKDGSRFPIRIQGFILRDIDDKKIVWGIIEDISEIKRLENELRQQAMCDYLTGAYNRRFFSEILPKAVNQALRVNNDLAVVIFDIDHFKLINDRFGHCIGDSILVDITSIVSANIRNYDILCRWGGEEFMLMLPSTDLQEGLKIADKLRMLIYSFDFQVPIKISCSFGLATLQSDDPESLIKNADSALYIAKQSGRNCVRCFQGIC